MAESSDMSNDRNRPPVPTPELLSALHGLGPAAIGPLMAIARDDSRPSGVRQPLMIRVLAIEVLAQLRAVDPIEPLFALLVDRFHEETADARDQETILDARTELALPLFGKDVLKPALAAYRRVFDEHVRRGVASVLTELRVHDDRVCARPARGA